MYHLDLFPFIKKLDTKKNTPEDLHSFYLHTLHIAQTDKQIIAMVQKKYEVLDKRLHISLFGSNFKNPIGIAAGYDKYGLAPSVLAAYGFGSIEVGTVTPIPQYGKPKPRFFQLEKDKALINRFGFSNDGVDYLQQNLLLYKQRNFVLGINIGVNQTSVEQNTGNQDYVTCIEKLHTFGDYFSINISSPNTQGLRALQAKKSLDELLNTIFRTVTKEQIKLPILIKIAPDLSDNELYDMLEVITSYPVAGIIATNTTVSRPKTLQSNQKNEPGGLSGKPVQKMSIDIIRKTYNRTKGQLPIIGVGGIFTTHDALEKLKAGASLLQIYTGIFYQGPQLAHTINKGLLEYMDKHKISSVKELVGNK